MIEELKILQEMFGQLTGLGGWAIGAYFAYKLIIIASWLLAGHMVLCSLKWYIEKNNAYTTLLSYDIDRLKIKLADSKDDFQALKDLLSASNRECEEVKHMYKILKEAKDAAVSG